MSLVGTRPILPDTRFISYVPGEYYLTQGHKGDERKHPWNYF